jgi:hypothetical protein
MFRISYMSGNADEAAAVPNAIAEVYVGCSKQTHPRSNEEAIQILQEHYAEEEKHVQLLSTNKSSSFVEYHWHLGQAINSCSSHTGAVVKIVDVAEPPKIPIGPNRRLGAELLICGVLGVIGRVWMTRRKLN